MAIINIKWTPARKKRARIAIVFCGVIILFLALNQVSFIAKGTHRAQSMLFAIGRSIGSWIEGITTSKGKLIEEKSYYQDLSADLATDHSHIEQLENDLLELQSLLGYQEYSPYHSTAARVIARSEKGENTFLVDKGSVDGVREGLAVIVEDGHMLGSVVEVHEHTSRVRQLNHRDSDIPAMILGTDETIGIVEGQEGYLLHMDFIPQRSEIQLSDVVVTSGLDGILPQGLILGVIDSILKDETAPFQEAFVRPIYDASAYSNVLIVDPFEPNL